MYFDDVEVGDTVFGLVFGKGKVIYSLGDARIQGFYSFEVEFENGQRVYYTDEGIPNWCSTLDFQTVFYANDICMCDLELEPVSKILSAKKIIKYRDKGILEMRCPSGVWIDIEKCPQNFLENALESGNFHLFRKIP